MSKITVETKFDETMIRQKVLSEDLDQQVRTIADEVINLRDVGVKEALVKLGWTPPREIQAIERSPEELAIIGFEEHVRDFLNYPEMDTREASFAQEVWEQACEWQRKQMGDVKLSADRWNALINCARIRPFGSAGLSGTLLDPNGVEWGNRAHLGVELWTKHSPCPNGHGVGVEWLTKFADKAILANKENTNGE